MRNEAYDKMAREALEVIARLPKEQLTKEVETTRNALNVVLSETDDNKLAGYYKRIEEFITVNYPKGLEYLNGQYLLTETVEG